MPQEIKQDINFLHEPLWFQDIKHAGMGFIWRDGENYEYRTDYKPPDKVDILILLYLMLKSQKVGYTENVVASRYEILKNCGLPIKDNHYYIRVEDSLKRWHSVDIYFNGTFYDRHEYYEIGFHILDSYKIEKDRKRLSVSFNADWLLKIKNSEYFKYINFEQYKALKRPVSRRLHEILCHQFFNRDTWSIHITRLGILLTLSGRKKITKSETKEIIYASDVLVTLKPAINEINKLARSPEVIKKAGIKPRDIFTITYEITGKEQDRVITFERHPVITEQKQADKSLKPDLQALLSLVKKRTDKLEKVVGEYYQSKGYEYVRWNVLYANKNAKKSYTTYLQKALTENWAEEWAEEERQRIELEIKRKEEEQKKAQIESQRFLERMQSEKEKPALLEAIANLDLETKKKLWEEAEVKTPAGVFRRESMVKVSYYALLCEHLEAQGQSFSKALVDNVHIAFELEPPC